MRAEDIFQGVNLGDTNVEFKGIIREGKDEKGRPQEIGWLKTIAAFANTEGGSLYIGIEDKTHMVVALDHETADKTILMIHRQIRQRITPSVRYQIKTVTVEASPASRYIVVVNVEPNTDLPVTVHEGGLLGIYVRNFGQTELASTEQIRDMVLMSESVPYDQPFTDKKFDKSDFSHMYMVASERGVHISEKQLVSIGFMSADKRLSRGALLFRDDCNDSQTMTVVSQWPDFTKGSDVVLATQEYTGDLLSIIEKSTDFVRNHSANGFRKEADKRVEYIAFPERSVTEGIVNAVGHRNYFIQGAQIEINIFRDRLEIISPGSLLGVRKLVKEKNIASIIPRRRNEVICAVLDMCRYMEKKGSGFDKIEEDYKGSDEAHLPYVSSDSTSFSLTMPDLTYSGVKDDEEERGTIPHIYAEKILTGKNDEKILSFCYYSFRSAKEIAEYIGIKPSTYFRKNTLQHLMNEQLLIKNVDDRVSKYKANHNLVKTIE